MKHLVLFLLAAAAAVAGAVETMTVCLRGNALYMRSSWDEKTDLLRICGLGGNKQFNYSYSSLVDKKVSDSDIMLKGKYFGRFHWCGDSTGVMHLYPDPAKRGRLHSERQSRIYRFRDHHARPRIHSERHR